MGKLLDVGVIDSDDEVLERAGVSIEELHCVSGSSGRAISLDAPIGEEGAITVGDLLPDSSADSEDQVIASSSIEQAKALLATQRELGCRILKYRWGFDGAPHTLEETGRRFGIPKERVRAIEGRSLSLTFSSVRPWHRHHHAKLSDYLD